MKQKLQERADALAGECIEEFLDVKRRKEDWDRVSLIQDQMLSLNAQVLLIMELLLLNNTKPYI